MRRTLDGLFSDGEGETRRRLYAEVTGLESGLPSVPEERFVQEFFAAQLKLLDSVATGLDRQVKSTLTALQREYLPRLPKEMRVRLAGADPPYTQRVREYESRGIWPYKAVADVFIERLGYPPLPTLAKRIEVALAVQGELWQMDATQFRVE